MNHSAPRTNKSFNKKERFNSRPIFAGIISFYLVLSQSLLTNASSAQPPPFELTLTSNASEQEILLTQAEEEYLSDGILSDIQRDFPIIQNPTLQSYINSVGSKLTQSSNLEGSPYSFHFYVVESTSLNAFSIPGGSIFISRQLIASLLNEAQLAGILSHEIAHVSLQHTAKRMLRIKNQSPQNSVLLFGGTLSGSVVGYGFGKITCPKKDPQCPQKTSLIGGSLGYLGAQLIEKYQFLLHSQIEELEADKIGLQLTSKAGYDALTALSYLELLKSKEGNADLTIDSEIAFQILRDFFVTHPSGDTRQKALIQVIKDNGAGPAVQFGPDRLLTIKDQCKLDLQAALEKVSKVIRSNKKQKESK